MSGVSISVRLLRAREIAESGCWEWTKSRTKYGYGKIRNGGEKVYAHRIAWTLWRGPIPEGLCVLHRCDNPPCFNPDHLFLGSQAENVVDRDEKGRGAHGSRNGNAKISDAEIDEIIRSSGTQAAIAKRFGITQPHVSRIRSGKRRV